MSEKIYSVKATKTGGKFSGLFKATSMVDATQQAVEELNKRGKDWNVKITELKNQKLAMKQFNAQSN